MGTIKDFNERLEVLITGGTFDKKYNFISGELYFEESHVPEMFKRGRSSHDLNIRTLMMIDSLEMQEKHRQVIALNCRESNHKHIIIIHGTDTMVETAEYLAKANIENKTIVLTGAIIPYKFGSSDGFFNLGSAVAFAQTLPAGVFVVMNGRYFTWDNVVKNKSTGYFEEIRKV